MVVTIHTNDGDTYTQTRRITTTNFDFQRLHYLNNLSREICEKKLTEQEIEKKLAALTDCKRFPVWAEVVCYMAIAGAFTLFFGGHGMEAIISLFIGGIVRIGLLFSEKLFSNKIFNKFFASVIVTLCAFLAVKFEWISQVDKVIIGNIMTLIPGIGLTNALRDLFTGDSIAGLLRSIEAILTALAIAAGYFLVAVLGGVSL
jgi:uncharacterized membrane protein YjjP (DUF1212 family)